LTSRVNDSLDRINREIQSLKNLRQQARRQKKGQRDVREQLSALEVMVKKVTEETVDHVLAEIREAWAQRAGLKTYADAVAQAMQAKTPGKTKLTMSVDRWKKFSASVSHEEARECAESMGIDVFWNWDIPRTPEGFYEVTGGRGMATARGVGTGPVAALVWREKGTPGLEG